MTAPSLELQAAIYAAVQADTAIMDLISDIYDDVPADPFGSSSGYIAFGPEDEATETGCVGLVTVSLQIDVWSRSRGRKHCKEVLHELLRIVAGVATDENPIVSRGEPFTRILRDPDGITFHGILQLSFGMEFRG